MPDSPPPLHPPSAPPRHLTAFRWAVLGIAVAWYFCFRLVVPLSGEPLRGPLHGNDFKHIYIGGWMLARGESPYDAQAILQRAAQRGLGAINPYVYLPFTGLVLSPLTLLDPPSALRLWFILNHLLFLGALLLVFRQTGLSPRLPNLALFALVAALCYPFYRTLTAGQLNAALLLLFATAFEFDRRDRQIPAGLVAAFAFLFKLTPGILFVYFLARRRYRAFLAMLAGTVAFLAISLLWVGIDAHLDYLPVLQNMGYGKSTWAEAGMTFYRDPANQSFNALFHHLLTKDPHGAVTPWFTLSPSIANALTWAAFLACFALVLRRLFIARHSASEKAKPKPDRPFALCLLLALLAPSIYWDHYAVIALWPLLLFATRLHPDVRAGASLTMAGGAIALGTFQAPQGALPAIGVVVLGAAVGGMFSAGRPLRERIVGAVWALAGATLLCGFRYDWPPLRHGPGLLLMSLKLWGTLALLCLWVFVHDATRREKA